MTAEAHGRLIVVERRPLTEQEKRYLAERGLEPLPEPTQEQRDRNALTVKYQRERWQLHEDGASREEILAHDARFVEDMAARGVRVVMNHAPPAPDQAPPVAAGVGATRRAMPRRMPARRSPNAARRRAAPRTSSRAGPAADDGGPEPPPPAPASPRGRRGDNRGGLRDLARRFLLRVRRSRS
jgi:hypothetical protein